MKLTKQEFDDVYTIMEEAFPEIERRSYEEQRKLLDDPYYHILRYMEQDQLMAIMACWNLPGCIFVEHFATVSQARGMGLGKKFMEQLFSQSDQNIILEVELPESEIAQRRIGFYQRLGFHLNTYEYFMPPLNKHDAYFPLMIMSYPKKLNETEFKKIRSVLYEYVYGIKNSTE